MKKLCLIIAGLFLATNCFAGAATVTQTPWGYEITGGTSATMVPQDTWVTATAYAVGNTVTSSGHLYRCLIAHTSGTFSTDLTALKWTKIGEATIWLLKAVIDPSASTDKAAFTALVGASDVPCFILKGTDPEIDTSHPQFYAYPFQLLKVTLTATGDVVNLYVFRDNFTGQEAGNSPQ